MYTLAQCHLHWGSEHTFDGVQDPLCMHCVHTKDDAVAPARTHGVLGFSWTVGASADAFLAQWIDLAPASGEDAVTDATIDMALSYADMNLAQYWQYDGGLTTPPCSEIVDWHFLMEKRTLTQAQLDVIVATTDVTGGNFRLPQPLGSRSVIGCAPFTTAWGWPEDNAWNTYQYSVCGTGMEQSPIDLKVCASADESAEDDGRRRLQTVGPIKDSDNPIVPTSWSNAYEFVHSHGMKVNMPSTESSPAFQTMMRGEMYTLAQCHLHFGSEHTFDGVQDHLCMHCVHTKDGVSSGRTHGVLGFTWTLGSQDDPFLAPWIAASPGYDEEAVVTTPANGVNMAMAYERNDGTTMNLAQYWEYEGGLTTPPCSEIVDWHVLMEKRALTQTQLSNIETRIGVSGGNFRSPQPLNDRAAVRGCAEPDDGELEDSGASRVDWRAALSILAFLLIR